jgi:uncharacterized protein YigA (DUF484 family)
MQIEWLITNPEYKVSNPDAVLEVLRIRTFETKRMISLVWRQKWTRRNGAKKITQSQ